MRRSLSLLRWFTFLPLLAVCAGCMTDLESVGGGEASDELQAQGRGCGLYVPGQEFGFADYVAARDAIGHKWQDTFSFEGLKAFNAAAAPEWLRALHAAYSQPEAARVFYGEYNGPDDGAHDGGNGFRVLWMSTVGSEDDRRLISVISFWTAVDGQLRLRGGPDSFRVRSQLAAGDEDSPRGRFGGMSLSADVDSRGHVTSVYAQEYADAEGEMLPGLTTQTLPSGCPTCHFDEAQVTHYVTTPPLTATKRIEDFRDFTVDEDRLSVETQYGLREFVEAHGLDKDAAKFRSPRTTFRPPGILEALDRACAEID